MEKKLKIEELAVMLGCSVQTINTWYKWKSVNRDNPIAELLPEYEQSGSRQTRLWKMSDVWKFVEFRQKLPRGRNGIMGDVTQRRLNKNTKNTQTKRRKRHGKRKTGEQ